jgi:hypothetical protein
LKAALSGNAESTKAAAPVPARVTTLPFCQTARILWLDVSQTMSAASSAKEPPSAGTVMPYILLKRAFEPTPLAEPGIPAKPARVVVTPAGVATRTT